jgi:dynein heavy chain
VPKEETTLVSDLRYGWRKLRKMATDVSDNLARLQVGNAEGKMLGLRACAT